MAPIHAFLGMRVKGGRFRLAGQNPGRESFTRAGREDADTIQEARGESEGRLQENSVREID
jgi:hypothetical protein